MLTPRDRIKLAKLKTWRNSFDDQLVGILNDDDFFDFHVFVGDCCPLVLESEDSDVPFYDFEGGEYPF
jgi:hypothetical protein